MVDLVATPKIQMWSQNLEGKISFGDLSETYGTWSMAFAELPSRSQSKPSNGIGNAWFQSCQAWNHSAPVKAVSGCGASQPPTVIRWAVGRFFARIFWRTLATQSRSGMGPLIFGCPSSFTRFVLNQKTTFTPLSTAWRVWVSLQAPQFCQAAMMGPVGKDFWAAFRGTKATKAKAKEEAQKARKVMANPATLSSEKPIETL